MMQAIFSETCLTIYPDQDTRTHSRLTPRNPQHPTCERTYAELRIYPGTLSSQDITARLSIEPTSSQDAGEVCTNSRARSHKVKRTGWFLSSEDHKKSLDVRDHLDWLAAQLLPARQALLALQQEADVIMTVCCVWWSASGHGGPVLWPEQMIALCSLNLECGFEFNVYGD